ncbi:MAG: hypothetical protein NXI03_11385 [Alphaproteobacteria bacterium]|nr:hypothetical protein [Alphaproteobacteria bacterium]
MRGRFFGGDRRFRAGFAARGRGGLGQERIIVVIIRAQGRFRLGRRRQGRVEVDIFFRLELGVRLVGFFRFGRGVRRSGGLAGLDRLQTVGQGRHGALYRRQGFLGLAAHGGQALLDTAQGLLDPLGGAFFGLAQPVFQVFFTGTAGLDLVEHLRHPVGRSLHDLAGMGFG